MRGTQLNHHKIQCWHTAELHRSELIGLNVGTIEELATIRREYIENQDAHRARVVAATTEGHDGALNCASFLAGQKKQATAERHFTRSDLSTVECAMCNMHSEHLEFHASSLRASSRPSQKTEQASSMSLAPFANAASSVTRPSEIASSSSSIV